jgi:hypothetical protein
MESAKYMGKMMVNMIAIADLKKSEGATGQAKRKPKSGQHTND